MTAVALALSIVFNASAQPAEKSLPISVIPQTTPVWCWAATIAMVANYTQRFTIRDCEVMAEHDMRLGGRGLCCANAPECVRGGATTEIELILGNVFGVHGTFITHALTFDEIVARIDQGRPLIAQLSSTPQSGHVVVVSGYRRPSFVTVLDPMQTVPREVPYTTLVNSNYGQWTGTFLIRSGRSPQALCSRQVEMNSPTGPRPRVVCSSNDDFTSPSVQRSTASNSAPGLAPSPPLPAPSRSVDKAACNERCDSRDERCGENAENSASECVGRGMETCAEVGCPCGGLIGAPFFACRAACNACLQQVEAFCRSQNTANVARCESSARRCHDTCDEE